MIRLLRSDVIYVNVLGAALILTLCLTAEQPVRKWPIGKETTYITEPVDDEGYIDYETALNDRLGKGITPEKNANVLIWKALGPRPEGGDGMPAAFFKRLGMEEPLEGGNYFVGLRSYAKQQLEFDPGQVDALDDQLDLARQRPWTAKDYPNLVTWLKANEKPLDLLVEATRRPEYFNPLVSRRTAKKRTGLIGALPTNANGCRQLAGALITRAMLKAAEGKNDDAWQDLLTCHRLSRRVTEGATLIEYLVALAMNSMASYSEIAFLASAPLTADQIRERLNDIQNLPSFSPLADKIDLGERFMCLDIAQTIRQGDLTILELFRITPAKSKSNSDAEKLMAWIDWEPTLRDINTSCDRMVSALRVKDRSSRNKELRKIEEEFESLKETEKANFFDRVLARNEKPEEVGKSMGRVLVGLLLPATSKMLESIDRTEQLHSNLLVAFALAAYRSDKGSYPAKLEDLAPKYLAKIPIDLFSGKALIYCPSGKGYLLYSVGVNGKDENGQTYGDDPAGDDIVVRMPLPELKVKQRE